MSLFTGDWLTVFTLEGFKNLVGYCGLYCGACGIRQGRIKQAVANLRKVIEAYGFDKVMPELAKWEPAFQHYPEFERVIGGLVSLFGECPSCNAGGGDPTCAVRECCRQKAHVTCAECDEMEMCEKVKHYGPRALEGLRRIKDVGIDNWTAEIQKKVNAGYCYLDDMV